MGRARDSCAQLRGGLSSKRVAALPLLFLIDFSPPPFLFSLSHLHFFNRASLAITEKVLSWTLNEDFDILKLISRGCC